MKNPMMALMGALTMIMGRGGRGRGGMRGGRGGH